MTSNHLPNFATNDAERTVAQAIAQLFRLSRQELRNAPAIAIATAYLNPGGFAVLADEIEAAPRVRILLGADPLPDSALAASGSKDALAGAQSEYEHWLRSERDMLGFTRENSAAAKRLVAWLRHAAETGEPAVDVKRYTKGFLHGKAFIVDHATHPAVIAGSSNMTYAGLMLNAELNIGAGADKDGPTRKVIDWFERYWDESEDFDLAAMYEVRWEEHSPWLVYLRMLWEFYGSHIEDERHTDTELKLTAFQAEGVRRMLRLLDQNNGVLVADEVGLGKTFLAGEVLAQTTVRDRQHALIVCPASLEKMWNGFLKRYVDTRRVDVISYDMLRSRATQDDTLAREKFLRGLDDYALVVIDEAHNLRNAGAERSKVIDTYLLGGANPKKAVLLTATPVNNSLSDLETLIRYFIRSDSEFTRIGIPSISEYIKYAQSLDPDSLSPKLLFDLMDQVAVRRTRKFVKDNYPNSTVVDAQGQDVPIVFPEPFVYRVDYPLDEPGRELLDKVIYALDVRVLGSHHIVKDDPAKLLLARYTPSGYYIDGSEEVKDYQISNAGLLRTSLLKRLESGPHALAATLRVMAKSHRDFLSALAGGYVMSGSALRDYANSDSEDLEALLGEFDEKRLSQVEDASLFHVQELRDDVTRDLEFIEELAVLASKAAHSAEPKVQVLIEQLRRIATEARATSRDGVSGQDRRKALVFSSFVDTVHDIHKQVVAAVESAPASDPLADYKGRIPKPITGARAAGDQKSTGLALEHFAPETVGELDDQGVAKSEDLYDLLITTDVLAEGVNLQQAGQIINYDLPWNPMRIVQRHGRIDRIGSRHSRVHLGCFFPDVDLDELLHLEKTLQRKIAYAAAAVGVGDVIPGQKSKAEVSFADRIDGELNDEEVNVIEQVLELAEGKAGLLENRGEGHAQSGEEYRKRLATALEDTFLKREVQDLPYASGSGFINKHARQSGYVWCMRMGDAETWFAWTPVDADWRVVVDDEGKNTLVADVLASLSNADPGDATTQRHLPDHVFDAAYDAWAITQQATWERWQKMTDPNALLPAIPPVMSRAFQLVLSLPGGLSKDEHTDLLTRLNTIPRQSVRRDINEILNSERKDADKVVALREIVLAAGVQPASAPTPLPSIRLDDVRLVAWMAVTAGKGQ